MKNIMREKVLIRFIVLAAITLQSLYLSSASAEIYKCTNRSGKVFYNDKPCPIVDEEKKMRAEKDVVNGYAPPLMKAQEQKGKSKLTSSNTSNVQVVASKSKKKSKKEDVSDGKLTGGNGSKNGSDKIEKVYGSTVVTKKTVPLKNYSGANVAIEYKRAYLGIRKDVE